MIGGIFFSGHSPYCSEGSMALLRIVDIMFRYREHDVIPAVVSSVRCAKTLHK